MKGLFGALFDFDGNGDLDCGEAAMEYMFLDDLLGSDGGDEEDEDEDL